MKKTLKPMFIRFTLTLLACITLSVSYASGGGEEPGSGKKEGPAETTTDLLKRRLLLHRLNSQSGDPLYFMLRSNKKEVKPREEVEITISVHLLQDAHKTFIVYEELFGYTLRLTMPEGFVVTGGSYHDLIRGRVTRQDPVKSYTVRGYFEEGCEECEFKLLRGTYYHDSNDKMVYRERLLFSVDRELQENKTMVPKFDILNSKVYFDSISVLNIAKEKEAASDIAKISQQYLTSEIGVVKVKISNLRYKDTCNYNPNMSYFQVDVINTGTKTGIIYAYLCKNGHIGLQMRSETLLAGGEGRTLEFNYDVGSQGSVHVHVYLLQKVGPLPGVVLDPAHQLAVSSNLDLRSNEGVNFNITADKTSPLVTGAQVTFTPVSCPAKSTIKWYVDNQFQKTLLNDEKFDYTFNTVGTKNVTAQCQTEKSCIYNASKSFNVQVNCNNVAPTLKPQGQTQVIAGNYVHLSAEGCDSDIKWYLGQNELLNSNSVKFSAYRPGSYKIKCKIGNCTEYKESNPIEIIHNGVPELSHIPKELSVYPNQKIILTASGCNSEYKWGHREGQKNNIAEVTGPGTYKVSCKNESDRIIQSPWKEVTFTLKTGTPPTLVQDGDHCLKPLETKNITATCNNGYTVHWGNVDSGNFQSTLNVSSGIYTAKCCSGENCSSDVSIEVCDGNTGCDTTSIPKVTINPGLIKMGDFFDLVLEGCSGVVTWYRDHKVYKEGGISVNTNDNGTYYALCFYPFCDTPVKSNEVTPNYTPLTIVHNVPNNEVVSGVHFELRAVGCPDGMIEWYTAAGTTRYDNPIWEPLPGTYMARCIKDGNAYSDWVRVHFTLRSATTPQFSKPEQCFFANQSLYISGTCSSGMTLRWNDNTTATSFPAYKQVTPGTYSAQCCNGSNCSAMTPVTVCTLTPDIQQIITDKDDPMTGIAYAAPNEPVLLTATGCNYGTVQWMYSGQTQWGNPVTVYGPGKYYARCFVTDHSTSPMISREIYPRTPGSVSIIPSQYTAYQGQMLTLTATGCNGGQVHWTYTEGGQTYNLSGRSVDVIGPNTYYAKCIVYGDTGPQSSITIPQASGLPKIITDKSRVRPNETFTFQVDFSNCPSYGWPGGSTLVTQEGVTTTQWGWEPVTLTGPAVLEARCESASWAKQTKEIFFAPGDNMRLVANKSKAKYNESVLLTTYGCDFGYVEWKIGDNMILGHELDPKRQITQTGPGFYKARCKNDFMVNSDWVTAYVDLDGSIVPVINGPNSLCPNTAATITTPGCPSGYYNVWITLEQGGSAPGGNSITVYLPQTVKLRCFKNDNSWTSDEKPFTIASAIPDDIKVTSNSPVVSGGTALLTGTSISGATYLWTPPAGVTLPILNNRILQIPNVTTAYSGEYKLKVSSGGCEVEVSSRVDVDLCDNLYIKAFDPANGEEKTRLTRKPGQLNLYDDLVLQVETFEGEILKGVEYTWTMPQGVTAGQDPAQKHKITINKIGNYKVNVTSAGGVSCLLEVDISALACATPADFLTCGSTSAVSSTGTEKLKNLAVGDVFSTYDYVVSVTEVSGSETSGWTGRGFIEMSFLKLGSTALSVPLAVRFENIHLNQCYQLLPGSKVITEFDPTWSNMADLDIIADQVSILYTEIKDLLATKPDNKEVLQAKLDELQTLKDDLASSGLQADYITEQTAALTSVIDAGTCYVGLPGARTTNSCSAPDFVAAVAGAEQILAKIVPSVYLSKINLSLNSSFAHGLADGIIDASPVGVVKFAWEVATDQEVRDALVQGVQALAADPAGVVKDIVTEKYDSWKNVLHGEGTEQQKYNVGKDLGNVIGALITAAGIIKLGNYINGRANVKQLANLAASNLKPLGLGSTGRNVAKNLTEQLAMKEILSNPTLGKIVMIGMKDSRWLGWNKMQYTHTALDGTKTTIHYVGKFENGVLTAVDDFKFK